MKTINHLLHSFTCCFSPSRSTPTTTTTTTTSSSSSSTIKSRLSSTFADLLKDLNLVPSHRVRRQQEDQDSLIDPADSTLQHSPSPHNHHRRRHHHRRVIGTLFGRRRSHTTTFSIQSDPSLPPPFLFDLPLPATLLAMEMSTSGILRLALVSNCDSWTAYCNGHKAGYAARRKPGDGDRAVLDAVKTMSAGAGVLQVKCGDENGEEEVIYMRACYERVVGSRDSVSFHMITPGGGGGRNSTDQLDQELSVFLLRTG